ncbi:Uncharacterised protein [Listeria grayi]|uniref:Uncharacterized protein n=1 Tax=Listeria grayi TaxID=1641 RepID=A0A378MCU8_LISGR|nr:Uncharacterised protein [Listeria grayi]
MNCIKIISKVIVLKYKKSVICDKQITLFVMKML